MVNTTLFKKAESTKVKTYLNCHGGRNSLDFKQVLSQVDSPSRRVRFIHHTILPSGASIGLHKHESDEEYYYFLSGKGVMYLNDEKTDIQAGDITGVFPGGFHGLENNSEADLSFIVISVLV